MLGPGQIPPQGAKALIKGLLRPGDGGGPLVSCVLFDGSPGETEIEFTNEGGETAVDLRYVIAETGGMARGALGHLAPGDQTTTHPRLEAGAPVDPIQCVWMYADRKRRLHVRSYDGRHERLSRPGAATDDACFRLMYG